MVKEIKSRSQQQKPRSFQCLESDLVNGLPNLPSGTLITEGSTCHVVDSPTFTAFRFHNNQWYRI